MIKSIRSGRFFLLAYFIVNAVVVCLYFKLIIPLLPVVAVVFSRQITRKERFIHYLVASKIKDLVGGPAKVAGKIYAEENLVSPYFKEACVGYSYKQEESHTDSEGETWYSTKSTESACGDFYLSDETGEIFVPQSSVDLEFCSSRSTEENKIRHTEFLLKHQQYVILSGDVEKEGDRWKFSSTNPIFPSVEEKTNRFKEHLFDIGRLKWYYIALYGVINYLTFFYQPPAAEPSHFFVVFSFFGLPLMGLFFLAIKRFANVFGVLAAASFIACLLSFPLMIIVYLQNFPTRTIEYIFYTIVGMVLLTSFLYPKDMMYKQK